MKFWIISILSCILIFSSYQSLYAQQYQDVIYLKNGGLIRGIIIEQIPYVSIKIQTKDGNIFVYKLDEIERITKETIKDAAVAPTSKKKDPVLASGLSCLGGCLIDVPGLGQFYNGDYSKGAMFTIASLSGVGLALWGAYGFEDEPEIGLSLILSGSVISLVSTILATIDAYKSAQTSSSVTMESLNSSLFSATNDYLFGVCLKVDF